MRQGNLTMIFLVLFLSCFIYLYMEQTQYDTVRKEKQKTEQALMDAIENAGKKFETVINASEEKRKQTFETSFFEAFYVSMGIFNEKEEQDKLRLYLPMLILAEEDGAFFCYIKEQTVNGTVELKPVWSDKISYGETELPVEKYLVSETLEQYASEIITEHNYIAAQYGISYFFHVPEFLEDTSAEIEFPMLFAVFQGWPLTAAGDVVYENCIDTGLYLQEVERYSVTGPESLSHPVPLYHKKSCGIIAGEQKRILGSNVTEEEAIRLFGAFPCEICVGK